MKKRKKKKSPSTSPAASRLIKGLKEFLEALEKVDGDISKTKFKVTRVRRNSGNS